MSAVRSLWQFRDFIRSAVINDVRNRFNRSVLGSMWAILQPLAQAAIFAVVMSVILQAKLPGMTSTTSYGAYLLSGLLGWQLFVDGLNQGLSLFLRHADMIKKVRFPLTSLPIIAAGVCSVNHLLLLGATLFILVLLSFGPTPMAALTLPLLWLVTMGLGLGVGLILGVINVFIRDMDVVVPIVTQLLFWFSPIVYMPSALPTTYANLLAINPMAGVVQSYQAVLVFHQWPEWNWLLYPVVLSLMCMLIARWLVKRCFTQMVDVL